MTDGKGAFGFGYELDIGGAQAAFAKYAGGKAKDGKKPSAGMTGITAGGKSVRIVGYGCGDDTPATALKETRRLMEQLKADVMIGPLSGDEAVAIANWAKTPPTKTVIIGTAASQDPTMQIAPKNVFRYHGDGAQWNAGLGEIVYKKLGWRKAAIIIDDYSFGWTSGGGGAQAYGKLDPKQHAGNLFFAFLGADKVVAPKVVGSYVGGFGTGPGLQTKQAKAYEAVLKKSYPDLPAADGFVYNYYNAAWAFVRGLQAAGGDLSKLQASLPKTNRSGYEVSDGGLVKLDRNRQAIQDQYPLQLVKNADGSIGTTVVGYVPNVDQAFGGLFKRTSPAPRRTQPACLKKSLPWQGKIKEVKTGEIGGGR